MKTLAAMETLESPGFRPVLTFLQQKGYSDVMNVTYNSVLTGINENCDS